MAILLSSANPSVLDRWTGFLKGIYETEKAQSLQELKMRCASRVYRAILLHRMLVDIPSFAELRSLFPGARFFILSDRPDEDEALMLLKMGIVGYGNTYIISGRLLEALRVVSNGQVWLGQQVLRRLIVESAAAAKPEVSKVDAEQLLLKLTKAERQIAEMIARGATNLEIAADLNITERTVKAHLTSIYEKTKTGNRLNLALLINLGRNPLYPVH